MTAPAGHASVVHTVQPTRGYTGFVEVSRLQEARVDQLIDQIRPTDESELHRSRVAAYVNSIVDNTFNPAHQVAAYTFGSVPLKTYLPDGDIDLSLFQKSGASLKYVWFDRLKAAFISEQQKTGPTRVSDVQFINAEIKLVKVIVDNIVVDITFESLGGLCTLSFLESVDRKLYKDHLFKRSIILVKGWCYYESRLLGAHHSLLSTYALETMVLYLLQHYHSVLQTPLKVLHKFLTVFSEFDWDNLCLSLQGPIPVEHLHADPISGVNALMHAQPLQGLLEPKLLNPEFYAQLITSNNPVTAPALDKSGNPINSFKGKSLAIMDPLYPDNNLGRSVNRASYFRMRKALRHGYITLSQAAAVDTASSSTDAIDRFFRSTWNAQVLYQEAVAPEPAAGAAANGNHGPASANGLSAGSSPSSPAHSLSNGSHGGSGSSSFANGAPPGGALAPYRLPISEDLQGRPQHVSRAAAPPHMQWDGSLLPMVPLGYAAFMGGLPMPLQLPNGPHTRNGLDHRIYHPMHVPGAPLRPEPSSILHGAQLQAASRPGPDRLAGDVEKIAQNLQHARIWLEALKAERAKTDPSEAEPPKSEPPKPSAGANASPASQHSTPAPSPKAPSRASTPPPAAISHSGLSSPSTRAQSPLPPAPPAGPPPSGPPPQHSMPGPRPGLPNGAASPLAGPQQWQQFPGSPGGARPPAFQHPVQPPRPPTQSYPFNDHSGLRPNSSHGRGRHSNGYSNGQGSRQQGYVGNREHYQGREQHQGREHYQGREQYTGRGRGGRGRSPGPQPPSQLQLPASHPPPQQHSQQQSQQPRAGGQVSNSQAEAVMQGAAPTQQEPQQPASPAQPPPALPSAPPPVGPPPLQPAAVHSPPPASQPAPDLGWRGDDSTSARGNEARLDPDANGPAHSNESWPTYRSNGLSRGSPNEVTQQSSRPQQSPVPVLPQSVPAPGSPGFQINEDDFPALSSSRSHAGSSNRSSWGTSTKGRPAKGVESPA